MALTTSAFLSALLISIPKGKYNDGGGNPYRGSVYFEAVLYDVVVWDRTHTFDGEPLPQEEQRARLYFFPFNCYKYEEQWEMKH